MSHYEVATTPYLPAIKQYTTLIPVLCDIVDEYLNLYEMEHELKLAVDKETAAESATVTRILHDLVARSKNTTPLESVAREDATRACLLIPFTVLSTGRALDGLSFHVWVSHESRVSVVAIAKTFVDEAERRGYKRTATTSSSLPLVGLSITTMFTDVKLNRNFEITCDMTEGFASGKKLRIEHKDTQMEFTLPLQIYYETYLDSPVSRKRRLCD